MHTVSVNPGTVKIGDLVIKDGFTIRVTENKPLLPGSFIRAIKGDIVDPKNDKKIYYFQYSRTCRVEKLM